MNNSEQFLMIKIFNKNETSKCEIQLNEVENIEKIKEDCKQKLGFENIDINKINLCFIDEEKDKIIINEFNDLIEYSNIKSEKNNLSIKLIAEISEEKKHIMDNQNTENNLKIMKKRNKIIDDNKDRVINELNIVIEKLKIKCKKYRDKIKKLTDNYEKIILDLKNVDSKKEENNNINDKFQNKNMKNLNSNDIKKKNILYRQDIQFINNKCNNCDIQNEKNNIFQCVSCENYYLCQGCHNKNKNNNKIHKHKYYFEIKFPDELIEKIKIKEKHDKDYYEITGKFNDFLNDIFFDRNGNLSKDKYIPNKSNIRIFNSLCKEMKKIKEDPLKYFEEYKITNINQKLERIEKEESEEKKNEIKLSVSQKLNLFANNNSFKFPPMK